MENAIKDISYAAHSACLLDIYPRVGAKRTFVYFHGGGLEAGDKGDDLPFFEKLNEEAKTSVVSVNYRLYPQAKYPDFLNDCAAAVAFVKKHGDDYGLGDSLYILGASAGAYMAMMLLFHDSFLNAHGIKSTDVAGFILDSPQPTDHFNVLREKGIDPRKVLITALSPLFYAKEKPFPPFLLISYQNDVLCRLEQNQMASKMFEAMRIPHTFTVLEGGHCTGSVKNESGEFSLLEPIKKFLNETEKK